MMYRICFTITAITPGMLDALLYTFFTAVFDCHMRTHACASKRSTNQEEFNLQFGKVLESAHDFFYLSAAAGSPTLLTSPKRQAMS